MVASCQVQVKPSTASQHTRPISRNLCIQIKCVGINLRNKIGALAITVDKKNRRRASTNPANQKQIIVSFIFSNSITPDQHWQIAFVDSEQENRHH